MSRTEESSIASKKSKSKIETPSKDVWRRRQEQAEAGMKVKEKERHTTKESSGLFSEGDIISLEKAEISPSLPVTETRKLIGEDNKPFGNPISNENNLLVVEKSYTSRRLFNVDYRKALFFLKEKGNLKYLDKLGIGRMEGINRDKLKEMSKEDIKKWAENELQPYDKIFALHFITKGDDMGKIDPIKSDLLVELNGNPFEINTVNVPKNAIKRRGKSPHSSIYAGEPLTRDLITNLIEEYNMAGMKVDWIIRGLSKLSGISRADLDKLSDWINEPLKKKAKKINLNRTGQDLEIIRRSLKLKYPNDWRDRFANSIWDSIERYELEITLEYNTRKTHPLKKNKGFDNLPIPYIEIDSKSGISKFGEEWWNVNLSGYIRRLKELREESIKKYAEKHAKEKNIDFDEAIKLALEQVKEINPIKDLIKIKSKDMKIMHDADGTGIYWAYWYYKIYENHLRDRVTEELSKHNFFGKKKEYKTYRELPTSPDFKEKKKWIREVADEHLQEYINLGYFASTPIFKSFDEWKYINLTEEARNIDIVRSQIVSQIFDWIMPNIFSQALADITSELIKSTNIEDPLQPIAHTILLKRAQQKGGVWSFKNWDPYYFRRIAGRVNSAILGYVLRKQEEHIEVEIDSGSLGSVGHKVKLLAFSTDPRDIDVEFIDQDEAIEEIKEKKKDKEFGKEDEAPNKKDITEYCSRMYGLGEDAIDSTLKKLLNLGLISYIRTEGHYVPEKYRKMLSESTPPIFLEILDPDEKRVGEGGLEVPVEGIYPLKDPNEIQKMLVPGAVEDVVFNAILEMLRSKIWKRKIRVRVTNPETKVNDWSVLEVPVDLSLYSGQHRKGQSREGWIDTIKRVDKQILDEIRENLKIEMKGAEYGVAINEIVTWMADNNIATSGRRLPQVTELLTPFAGETLLSIVGKDKVSLTGYGKFWAELLRMVNPIYISPELTRRLKEDLIPDTVDLLDIWSRVAKNEKKELTPEEINYYKKMKEKKIQSGIGFIGLKILEFLTSIELDHNSLKKGIRSLLKSYNIGVYSPSTYVSEYNLKQKLREIEGVIDKKGYISPRQLIRMIWINSSNKRFKEWLGEVESAIGKEKKPKQWDQPDELLELIKDKLEYNVSNLSYSQKSGESFKDYVERFGKVLSEWNLWFGIGVEKEAVEGEKEKLGLLALEVDDIKEDIKIIPNKKIMDELSDKEKYKIRLLKQRIPLNPTSLIKKAKEEYKEQKELEKKKIKREIDGILSQKPILKKSQKDKSIDEKIKIYQNNIVHSLKYVKNLQEIREKYPDNPILRNEVITSKNEAVKNWNIITKIINTESQNGRDIIIPELWTKIDFNILLDGYLNDKIIDGKKGDYVKDWIKKIETWISPRLLE